MVVEVIVSGWRPVAADRAGAMRAPGPARTAGWWAVVLGVVAVALVMAVRVPHSPPLYDGVGFPDEPYRWVEPPVGAPKTPAVTPATTHAAITGGASAAVRAFSAEQGPQIAFAIPEGGLKPPAGAHTVTLDAVAVAPPPIKPSDGTLVSNVYSLTAKADSAGTVGLSTGTTVVVNLRADKSTQQGVVLETFTGNSWSQVATGQVGTDIYAAELGGFGRFALVRLPAGAKPTVTPTGVQPTQGGGFNTTTQPLNQGAAVSNGVLYISAGVMVLLLLGGLYLARRRMSRR